MPEHQPTTNQHQDAPPTTTTTETYESESDPIINLLVRRRYNWRALFHQIHRCASASRVPCSTFTHTHTQHTRALARSLSLVVHVVPRNLRIPSSYLPVPARKTRASSTRSECTREQASVYTQTTVRRRRRRNGITNCTVTASQHTHTSTHAFVRRVRVCVLCSIYSPQRRGEQFFWLLTIWRCDFVIERSFGGCGAERYRKKCAHNFTIRWAIGRRGGAPTGEQVVTHTLLSPSRLEAQTA